MNQDKGNPEFTDLTNTLYFLSAYVDKIRYCITWDKFLVWNGTNWEIDYQGFVQERIPIFIHQMYRIQRYIPDPILKRDSKKHLITKKSNFIYDKSTDCQTRKTFLLQILFIICSRTDVEHLIKVFNGIKKYRTDFKSK